MIIFCIRRRSNSEYIAVCDRIINKAGLKHEMNMYGTNIEGEWNEVMAGVKKSHEVVHKIGAQRISTTIRLGTRVDKDQAITDKIKSIEDILSKKT